ncbi:MAG: fluoride efflux transporter CrcB [Caulobacteraceae bacterium]
MQLIIVGIGGLFGSITRYFLGKLISEKATTLFPLGTFIINITGAFLLGIISTIKIDNNLYILLGDGFLGAYTTFSTFMYEGFYLFHEKEKLNAFTYIFLSLIVGVLGYATGSFFGKATIF